MRILIDTNIFIYRENDHILPENLQVLLKVLNQLEIKLLIHPYSIKEIMGDLNEERKNIALSKLKTYPTLESPPDQNRDTVFYNVVGQPSKINDDVDNAILYAVYKDAVDFLITEDKGIHKKAIRLNIKDRVLSLEEALSIFINDINSEGLRRPPALNCDSVYNLNVNDPFFNSLKEEYGESEFEDWFIRISREGRKCWIYSEKADMIGALLIYKVENEPIDSIPSFPAKKRLKLSTFKVKYVGHKIGELFIKLAVGYCIRNNIDEMYLTHFTKSDDYLVDLITEYGFYKAAIKSNGEDIYMKELLVNKEESESMHPVEISKRFYPSFYDGVEVNKFVVPIEPEFHDRLFTENIRRQTKLNEFDGDFIIEGNTILKAYLCHSNIKRIIPGDILLFYRSKDIQAITSLGIVEKVFQNRQSKDEIIKYVGKRTVYTIDEIADIAQNSTLVILFTWHFHLAKQLNLSKLKELGILKSAPQSITQRSHQQYLLIKSNGGINERFTVN